MNPALTSVAIAAALASLLAPHVSPAPQADWSVLERVIASHDVPSTDAERVRTPLASDAARVLYLVRPHDTDPAIDHFLKDHYAIFYRSAKQNGLLFVFFPGTYGQPHGYQLLLDEAARAGYKAVGLEYPDANSDPRASAVAQICARIADPDCPASVRRARLSGGTAPGGTSVTPANSILNRLASLLRYLDREHPADGWGAFLRGTSLAWDRMAAGGHSQGAGMAAFLAKEHLVARVALWSGPFDYLPALGRFPPWMETASATPLGRWYGMVHADEPGESTLIAGWRVLGLPGQPVVLGGGPIPAAHGFIVTRRPRGPASPKAIVNAAHGSVATDFRTPLDGSGRPAYGPVWDAMFGRERRRMMRTAILLFVTIFLVAPAALSQPPDDRLIVPGVQIGKWRLGMSVDELARIHGKENGTLRFLKGRPAMLIFCARRCNIVGRQTTSAFSRLAVPR